MFRRTLGNNRDLVMVLLVVGILTVLFVPIPAGLLDFLILANVSFALLILLLTFYMARPVEFSTFPSLLLIATLFRLSLNVATTRLILTDANAGKVISAIGAYVVGGNYVIGLIVFLILVVVQYVVVTNGAQRVSEVAARFTLDSLPGQQMSIDADLNMGFIDQNEAKLRRKLVEKESGFYGAMDGASKFVKGDAIAGIIIMLINIVGGLIIGVMQMGMSWGDAMHTFTLLTVGDGIVTQVPALVIAVGTGIIVTRSTADANLSSEALRQITLFPKTIFIVAGALAVLLFLPGIPSVPVLLMTTILLATGWYVRRHQAGPVEAAQQSVAHGAGRVAVPTAADDDNPYQLLKVEPVEVALGEDLTALVNGEHTVLMTRVAALRRQFALDSGMVLPSVRFRGGPLLAPSAYEIAVDGVKMAQGDIMLDRTLAITPGPAAAPLKGIATREPSFGMPALWIQDADREAAQVAKYTLVDPASVFITHLSEVLKRHAPALLTRQETENLLKRVRDQQPGLVEELIPTVLSVTELQKVLQELVREKVSIRNLEAILETLADAGKATKDTLQLVDAVRQRLGPAICQAYVGERASMAVITLHPDVERTLRDGLSAAGAGQSPVVEPKFSARLIVDLAARTQQMVQARLPAVLLCAPDLRLPLRRLTIHTLPSLGIVSMTEVPGHVTVRCQSVVTATEPGAETLPAGGAPPRRVQSVVRPAQG